MSSSRGYLQSLLLALLTAVFLSTPLSAQTIQVGAGAGVRFPLGDAGGDTKEYYAGTKYGLSTGYNLQAKGRLALAGVTLVGEIGYGQVSNSGEAEPGQGKVEVSQSVFMIKAGPEFHFKLPIVSPYIGATLAYNSISGETTFNGVSRVPSGTHDVETAGRFGFGLMGGGIVELSPLISLDLNLEYAWINPFTKEWKDMNPAKDQRLDSYLALNDDKDPLLGGRNDPDEHFIAQARSISAFAVTVTVMFSL